MVITGKSHSDSRGIIRFVNDFDMSQVVRMYCVKPDLSIIKAWQGHQKEAKWFYVAKGSFLVKTVEMDSLKRKEYILKDSKSEVLKIPGGHYNGFVALEEESVLIVFSDFGLEESKGDDYRESLTTLNW